MIIAFIAGWAFFIYQNITQLSFNWEMIACGVVALIMATYGFHRLVIWIRKEKLWQWRWSLSIVTLMLFLFAASIAMTGIIHQSAWLVKSPMLHNSRTAAYRTKSVAHLKQIYIGILMYEEENKKYPDSLEQIREVEPRMSNVLLYCQTEDGWEPWIYLGNLHNAAKKKGKTLNLPLAMSPVAHPVRGSSSGDGKYVVLELDKVLTVTKEQLRQKYPELETILPYLFE